MRALARERNIEEDDVLFFSFDPVTEGYFAALNAYTSQTRFARHLRKDRPKVYAEVVKGAMGRDNDRIRKALCAYFHVEVDNLQTHLERAMGVGAIAGYAVEDTDFNALLRQEGYDPETDSDMHTLLQQTLSFMGHRDLAALIQKVKPFNRGLR